MGSVGDAASQAQALPKRHAGRRAPRACQPCRSRKVRCDVTKTKTTCTNCRLDSKDCVLPVSKRRHLGDRVLCSSFNPQTPICDVIIDFGDVNKAPATIKTPIPTNHDDEGTLLGVFGISGDDLTMPQTTDIFGTSDGMDSSWLNDFKLDIGTYPSPPYTAASELYPTVLPPYIDALSKGISGEDREFLQSKGAFDLPDAPTRDLLLQAYIMWVHPLNPMLDLEGILAAVFSNGSKGRVSLLVFQSLLFAATAFTSSSLGYADQRAARRVFYDRARLLHDFDIESDRLAITQSAVLLSFWDGDSTEVRDSYYWVGIATLHAASLGLNSDPTPDFLEPSRRRAFKLTSWSLIIRDRLIAMTLRRPVQNTDCRLKQPMLLMEDFEIKSLSEALQDTSLVPDLRIEDLETLASCCMALGQLSQYIDRVLSSQYAPQRAQDASGNRPAVVSLVPKVVGPKHVDIRTCGDELQTWYTYLPFEVRRFPFETGSVSADKEHDVVQVHKALLEGYYSMVLMTMYRPLLTPSQRGQIDTKMSNTSARLVMQATRSITDVFGRLYAQNLIQFLPDTAIAVLEPAVVTHLLYSMSEDPDVREITFQKFYLCWRILLEFRKSYHHADTTLAMLNAAAQRLKENVDQSPLTSGRSPAMDKKYTPARPGAEFATQVHFTALAGKNEQQPSWTPEDIILDGLLNHQDENPDNFAADGSLTSEFVLDNDFDPLP
ncbi:hypothetical protein LTR47_006114 [Exophiala xenobiotica]|nr:hypothetical protein LTR47_006114 [Exophiala xenobiotica]KAK5255375.1 hypothetical protein LTS06_000396 [Exophiala xenobiotica]KAK5348601.1 hypothetical protein LTR61_007628 [Exophiala xenobiotica]KAK5366843.1 hypothetical protein LTR11_008011 [Exophiala xenobiotica]KAK5368088.1 hypothetical protein LTS03_008232 [Exophiala xenobiotica]